MNSALLSPRDKCVVRWADLVTRNEAKFNKECWEELKTHFTPQELVELTMSICLFNAMNRLNDSLQLEFDLPPGEMRSLKVTPQKMADYAREVLAHTD